eukprot:11425054-Alexandrium_andersonii.AAC.1
MARSAPRGGRRDARPPARLRGAGGTDGRNAPLPLERSAVRGGHPPTASKGRRRAARGRHLSQLGRGGGKSSEGAGRRATASPAALSELQTLFARTIR